MKYRATLVFDDETRVIEGNMIDCSDPISVPMPATASSVPIEQPMSERERLLVHTGRQLNTRTKMDMESGNVIVERGYFDLFLEALAAYKGEGK